MVDDAKQAISEIVRRVDLLDSTPRQILLERLLRLPTLEYLHLPLALDCDGRKLNKHECSVPIDCTDPLPVLPAALALLGQPIAQGGSTKVLLRHAIDTFEVARIPRSLAQIAATQEPS